jgi:hypothetical protein
MARGVERLRCKCEALGSNSSPIKKKKKKDGRDHGWEAGWNQEGFMKEVDLEHGP